MKKILSLTCTLFIIGQLLAQNVGIGTSTPLEAKLVVTNNNNNVLLAWNSTPLAVGVKSGIYLKTGNLYTGGLVATGSNASNYSRVGLYSYASGLSSTLKERLTITDSGFVGINDTAPQVLFQLKGHPEYPAIKRMAVVDNATLVLNGGVGLAGGALRVNNDANFSSSYVTIDNTSRLGIGTVPGWPVDILVSDGDIRIRDGNEGAGKVLTSDASGIARWQINSKPKSLSGFLAATQSITGNGVFNTIAFATNTGNGFNDISGSFDNATSTFTVPAGEAGTYLIQVQIKWSLPNAFANNTTFVLSIAKNGSPVASTSNLLLPDVTDLKNRIFSLSTVLKLTAGQTIKFACYNFTSVSQSIFSDPAYTNFNITKLY